MASIFVYNPQGSSCLELNSTRILEEDLQKLKIHLPENLQGLAFRREDIPPQSLSRFRTEENQAQIAKRFREIAQRLLDLRQWWAALQFLKLAFRIHQAPEFLWLQAEILSQIGEVERADRLLARYLQARPQDPQALFLQGKHALSRSDYENAGRVFERALAFIEPISPQQDFLKKSLEVYREFAEIYSQRDELFDRNLRTSHCAQEVQNLLKRAQNLQHRIQEAAQPSWEGMSFFLDHEIKIFEQWLIAMKDKK